MLLKASWLTTKSNAACRSISGYSLTDAEAIAMMNSVRDSRKALSPYLGESRLI